MSKLILGIEYSAQNNLLQFVHETIFMGISSHPGHFIELMSAYSISLLVIMNLLGILLWEPLSSSDLKTPNLMGDP